MEKKDKLISKEIEIPVYFHNYKLLKDKEFILKGSNVYFVQGRNKAGKTSFIKALTSLQTANDDTPKKVTEGEEKGYYEATIPSADGRMITIRHEFTNDKGRFVAVDENGQTISSVTEIRRMFNYTPLNINDFFAMSNTAEGRRKQREIILKLLPEELREKYDVADKSEYHYYTNRTEANRKIETTEATIKSLEITPENEELINKEQTARDLCDLYRSALKARGESDEITMLLKRLESEHEVLSQTLKNLEVRIADTKKIIENTKSVSDKFADLSDETLQAKIEKGETILASIADYKHKISFKKEWDVKLEEYKKQSADLDKKIKDTRKEKQDIIESSDLPVKNVSFEDGYLTIDGYVFKESQVCESDGVLILARILAEINPGPIQLIGDASCLDNDNLARLNQIAEECNKVMFVDEIVRDASELAIVGYEDIKTDDLEKNLSEADKPVKKGRKPKVAAPEVEQIESFTGPSNIQDPEPEEKKEDQAKDSLLF